MTSFPYSTLLPRQAPRLSARVLLYGSDQPRLLRHLQRRARIGGPSARSLHIQFVLDSEAFSLLEDDSFDLALIECLTQNMGIIVPEVIRVARRAVLIRGDRRHHVSSYSMETMNQHFSPEGVGTRTSESSSLPSKALAKGESMLIR